MSSRFFEFISPTELLVSHEYKGVFRLQLNDDFTKVTQVHKETSAPMGRKSAIAKYRNEIWYFTEKGLFKYNTTTHKFVLHLWRRAIGLSLVGGTGIYVFLSLLMT